MIGDVLVPYTIWNRFAKTSHDHGIPLTNISAATGLTTEVFYQSYSKFIPNTKASQHGHSNENGK